MKVLVDGLVGCGDGLEKATVQRYKNPKVQIFPFGFEGTHNVFNLHISHYHKPKSSAIAQGCSTWSGDTMTL